MSAYLVLGGTGKVGRRVARILRERGEDPRVASRSGGDVRFDWHDAATYDGALAGAAGVLIVGPGSASDWSPLLRAFLERAATAGVRRAVLLSARGVEFLPDGAVGRAERALQAGPLAWTILRPAHFAQNFTEAMFVPVDGTVTAPVGAGAEPFVDVEDVAEVAATALTSDTFAGDIIELSGPRALTFDEALAVLGARAGAAFTFIDEAPDVHAERLRAAGTPEGYVTWRMAMLDGIRTGADAYVSDGVERVLGRPPTGFAAWAEREAPGD